LRSLAQVDTCGGELVEIAERSRIPREIEAANERRFVVQLRGLRRTLIATAGELIDADDADEEEALVEKIQRALS
jgi:hypothetical protein